MYGIKKVWVCYCFGFNGYAEQSPNYYGKLTTRLSLLFVWLKSLALAETWAWFEVFRLERQSLKYQVFM